MGLFGTRRARGAESTTEPRTETAPETAAELGSLGIEPLASMSAEEQVRVLREQVRALEQALAHAPELDRPAPVAGPAPLPAPAGAVAGSGLEHALIVARAVAGAVHPDDDPRRAADRVVACLEHLGAAPEFARPVADGVVPAPTPVSTTPLPVSAQMVTQTSAPTPVPIPAAAPLVDGPEVVLPIPPPAVPEPTRARRGHRGRAA